MQPELLSTTYTEQGLTWASGGLQDDDDASEASLLNDQEKQSWETDLERDLREETGRLDDSRRPRHSQWRGVLDATLLLVVLVLLFERGGSRERPASMRQVATSPASRPNVSESMQ